MKGGEASECRLHFVVLLGNERGETRIAVFQIAETPHCLPFFLCLLKNWCVGFKFL